MYLLYVLFYYMFILFLFCFILCIYLIIIFSLIVNAKFILLINNILGIDNLFYTYQNYINKIYIKYIYIICQLFQKKI